jgi:hypothetical protein
VYERNFKDLENQAKSGILQREEAIKAKNELIKKLKREKEKI